MRARPPRLLAATHHLATLYIRCSNRIETGHIVQIVILALLSAMVGTTSLVWIHRPRVAAAFNALQDQTLMIALLVGIVAAVAVAHQRSVHMARAAHSWLAALPTSPRARRAELLTLQLAPVITALVLVSGFCLIAGATLAIAGLPTGPDIVAWRSVLLGTVLGAAVGLAVPLPKLEVLDPSSRYVPHRAMHGRRPVPSIAALKIWPIRRMFAMLRPKTLSRAMLPVLLAVPLGTTGAAAMVWIAQLGAVTALVLLAMSVVDVTQKARQWLKPLPLSLGRLGLTVALRALLVMFGIGAVLAWLGWIGSL